RIKYFDDIIPAILEQITIYMLRGFIDRIPDSLSKTPTDEELCKHVSHYIDTHLFTMSHLSECAKALSYNYCYLTTVFKKTMGITLSEYHRGKKLDMSKALIIENEHTLSEIAELLGYSGISAFSKAFSARFDMSPREYAKMITQN
ncbi:MAG: helix-turn-helix transcriptional regulator, partial [Clostridia bacterium]|nr:helix-turn-helix transcriptional regulator [Clostridia bacterium]